MTMPHLYGNWICFSMGFQVFGHPFIPDSDNGLASVWRVNSQDYYRNIGCTYDPHLYLQKENEYDIAYPILL
jgi:hypothetical protein